MPIDITDLQQVAASTAAYSPKFFSPKFTGQGKGQGLLNKNINPGAIKTAPSMTNNHVYTRKRQIKNGDTMVYEFPFNVVTADLWPSMAKYEPDDATMALRANVGNRTNGKDTRNYFVDVRVHSMLMDERPNSNNIGYYRKVSTCYQVFLYSEIDPNDRTFRLKKTNYGNDVNAVLRSGNVWNEYTYVFATDLRKTLEDIRSDLALVGYADAVMFQDYLDSFSVYEGLCRESEVWQSNCDEIIEKLMSNIDHTQDTRVLNDLAVMLAQLEQYPIPLELYQKVYASTTNHFNKKTANTLCKQNLNLLLNDTLAALNNKKAQLSTIPNPATPIQSNLPLSAAQTNAVSTDSPLTLIQAGAGSGKSSVILERINWMIQAGVKPEDITVISFTNAAADNITEKQPFVHSMTSCAMINTIYMENFPTHKLNTMESLASTLRALYPSNSSNPLQNVAMMLARHIDDMTNHRSDRTGSNPQTRLNNFIENRLDEVLKILDEIGQTTLELQIIICYQMINRLKEPASTLTKYLIIDEVQDNSVFEFIYFLRYAAKHSSSLFMVGDCSQTLYEFRASNPKALNALEGSGIFTTYQLDINYRSNQEILDFANVGLSLIEANQYAHIQLKANALARVTSQSFKEKVKIRGYKCSTRGNEFNQELPNIMMNDLKDYIDDKVARGEQVAFLAYPRVQVSTIERTLRSMYPGKAIVNLVGEQSHSMTIFTRFISEYWDQIKFAPTQDLDTVIANVMTSKFNYLLRRDTDQARQTAFNYISQWRRENCNRIKSWANQYLNGVITLNALLDNTKQNMIDFEVHSNAVAQMLKSKQNNEKKNEQDLKAASFVVSTIHSAKGREFPHAVIIYKDSGNMSEPDKRAYYVALTRAMQTEFVVAYSSHPDMDIVGQYVMLTDALEAAEKIQASGQPIPDDGVDIIDEDAHDIHPDDTNVSE
ncbi:MAG: ATP-dependent helicase [Clostridia bacterium]|nr:ATP-dependent helicase [Clostridia bacterium]